MALIADGDGGGGRTTPLPAAQREIYRYRWPGSPYSWQPSAPTTGRSWLEMLPGRALWPEEMAGYTPPTGPPPLGPPVTAGAGGGVTIRVGPEAAPAAQQPQYANWWEQPGAMQPAAAPAAAPQATPTPWWGQYADPLWEGMGAPQDWLNLRTQDWAALPSEVRSELERWLRGFGWRPGGRYGRYGALEWGRAEGATPWAQAGQQLGQEAFAGVPENLKPWLFWLSKAKGWMQGEAARPETAGWSW